MKKIFSLFAAVIMAVGVWADVYQHTFATDAKTFTADGTATLSDVSWTLATTWVDATKTDYNRDTNTPSQGMKLGSNSKAIQTMSLSTSGISGTITSVYVETNARSGADVAMSVKVGGTAFSGDASFTGTGAYDTRKKLTYTGSASGQIVIAWDETEASSSKKGAFYVTAIKVTYTQGEVTYYNVNIADGIQNGTVKASKNTATAGAVITLTATPATGYKFSSWNVTNASTSAAITVTNNEFTMPAADVNISATFIEKPAPAGQTVAFVLEYNSKMLAAGVNIASNKAPAIEVSVKDGKVYAKSEEEAENFAWLLIESDTEGKYVIQPKNDTEKYLSAVASSANVSLATSECLWTAKGDGSYWIPKADGTQAYYRTMTYQAGSTNAFKAYTASNIGASGYASTAAFATPIVLGEVVSVSAAGYATYYNADHAVVVPADVEAYIWNNGLVKQYEAEAIIPAGTPVVLKAEEGTYGFEFTTGGIAPATNDLQGAATAMTAAEMETANPDAVKFYALSLNAAGEASSVGFYWVAEGGAAFDITAGKAYLALSASEAPARFLFNETTALENKAEAVKANKTLVNGQLFILRDGKTFDVMGRIVK